MTMFFPAQSCVRAQRSKGNTSNQERSRQPPPEGNLSHDGSTLGFWGHLSPVLWLFWVAGVLTQGKLAAALWLHHCLLDIPTEQIFFLGGRMIFAASHSPYPWDDEGIPFILPDPSWKSCWDTSASPQPFFPTAQAQSNPPHRHKVGI